MSTIRPIPPSLPYDCTLCHYLTHHVTPDHTIATATIRQCRKHEEKPYPPVPSTPCHGRNLKESILGALDKLHIANTPAAAKIVAEDTTRMMESNKRPDFTAKEREKIDTMEVEEGNDSVIYLGQNVKGGSGGDDSELFWWEMADRKIKQEEEETKDVEPRESDYFGDLDESPVKKQ